MVTYAVLPLFAWGESFLSISISRIYVDIYCVLTTDKGTFCSNRLLRIMLGVLLLQANAPCIVSETQCAAAEASTCCTCGGLYCFMIKSTNNCKIMYVAIE